MNPSEQRTYDRLITKSQEAFILAVELYNRPSIRYHAEGCALFLCNAWELMLKAYIVMKHGEQSIYYRDNPSRTLSLEDCLKKVFTNKRDPLRENMRRIIDLRNTCTHFITEEYELFYGPIFQVCVKNYDEKLRSLHDIEISDLIPENHLVLSVKRDLFDPEKVRARYSPEVVEKMLLLHNSIAVGAGEDGDRRYAGLYETSFVITKNPEKADLAVRIDKNADAGIIIVKDIKLVSDKYPYTTKLGIEAINKKLSRKGIDVFYRGENKGRFNSFHWNAFVRFYAMKESSTYTHNRAIEGE
jgi:hypothetical protein